MENSWNLIAFYFYLLDEVIFNCLVANTFVSLRTQMYFRIYWLGFDFFVCVCRGGGKLKKQPNM